MEISKLPPEENIGVVINAIIGVFLGVGLILVCLRIFVRTKINKAFGWDDTLIILALIAAFIALGIGSASVHYGIGRHTFYLEPIQLIQAVKWEIISQLPWVISTMFTRLSIGVFLYRIFATKKVWKWALYPILGLNIIGSLASFTTILPQCSPVEKHWNPTIPGSCWDPRTQIDIELFQGAFSRAVSVFCDFALAFLPIVFLWNIHIKNHIKLGICVLMGLGFFTGVCAIVRIVLLAGETSVDYTYSVVTLEIWAILEMSIGIILACVPTIRPLFRSDFLDYLRSHIGRHYSKFHHIEAGYVSPADDQQRLHRVSSVEAPLHTNAFPSCPQNPGSSQAYGNFTRSEGARVPERVFYRDGISRTTEFELSTLNQQRDEHPR